MSKEFIVRLRESAAQRVASTAMIGAEDLSAAADALESLEDDRDSWERQAGDRLDDVLRIVAERDALAAELKALREQVPVGVVDESDDGVFADLETTNGVLVKLGDKLYAHPIPVRELTDEDIQRLWDKHGLDDYCDADGFARAIERHMKGEGE